MIAIHRVKDKDGETVGFIIDEAYVVEITRGGVGNTVKTIPIYTVGCRFPYNE